MKTVLTKTALCARYIGDCQGPLKTYAKTGLTPEVPAQRLIGGKLVSVK